MFDDGLKPQGVIFSSNAGHEELLKLALDTEGSDIAIAESWRLRDKIEPTTPCMLASNWGQADVRIRVRLTQDAPPVAEIES
jgi:hypothetical protein